MTSRRTKKAAELETADPIPHDWEKALSCAYLRTTGLTQAKAAGAVGVGERTLRVWEASSWWPECMRQAHERWLTGFRAKVINALDRAMDDPEEYATTARWAADRMIPEFAPPRARLEHTGKDGGPITFENEREAFASALAKLAARIRETGSDK